MTPSPTLLGRSAYSVLGGLGYLAAITVATVLAITWQLTPCVVVRPVGWTRQLTRSVSMTWR